MEGSTNLLLIITGTMGAGKTAVLAEASDILALRQIAHAAIDLDALGLAHLPFGTGTMASCTGIFDLSARITLPSACSDSWWRARWKTALN